MCKKSSIFVANFKRIEWRKVMETPTEDIIRSFEPISLAQMESVKLMNRIDTKYAVPMAVLPAILEAAQADYYAQEIDGKRIATYDTMYYDTESLDMYVRHHDHQLVRLQIRLAHQLR